MGFIYQQTLIQRVCKPHESWVGTIVIGEPFSAFPVLLSTIGCAFIIQYLKGSRFSGFTFHHLLYSSNLWILFWALWASLNCIIYHSIWVNVLCRLAIISSYSVSVSKDSVTSCIIQNHTDETSACCSSSYEGSAQSPSSVSSHCQLSGHISSCHGSLHQ